MLSPQSEHGKRFFHLTLIGLGFFLTCLGLGGGIRSMLFVDLSQRNFAQQLIIKASAQIWEKFYKTDNDVNFFLNCLF